VVPPGIYLREHDLYFWDLIKDGVSIARLNLAGNGAMIFEGAIEAHRLPAPGSPGQWVEETLYKSLKLRNCRVMKEDGSIVTVKERFL
jgi:hypothetical protein